MNQRVRQRIPVDERALATLCRRYGVKRLAVFGSVLRDDFRDDSDVDVLVEFMPERVPGFAFFALQDELTVLFGRTVDLNTPGFVSRRFRGEVLGEAEDLDVAA